MFVIVIDFIVAVAFILAVVFAITGAVTKNKKTLKTALVAAIIWLFASCISAIISSVY